MKRTEIWLINLDPAFGAEIRKTRPAVIVNDDSLGILPLKVIVPITDWKSRYVVADWMVKLDTNSNNNLKKTSAADCFQVRSLSQSRMVRKIGEVSSSKMQEIEIACESFEDKMKMMAGTKTICNCALHSHLHIGQSQIPFKKDRKFLQPIDYPS